MIRNAEEKDLVEILAIYNDAIIQTTAVYTYKPETLQDKRNWFTQKKKDGFPLIVWEEDGKVAAFASFGHFRAWPAYKYSIEHSIYVDTNYRQRGIAKKLLAALINIAKEREYKSIIAGIDANNEASIILHEKFDFEYCGTIKQAGYKFERWLDLAFYRLELEGPKMPIGE